MEVHLVTVTGEAPRIEGWGFIAILERIEGIGRPIIHAHDRKEISEKFKSEDCPDECEHCNTQRNRKKHS
nr:hypothetical protein [Methylomarinum sp. Ch1-1]MDP4523316.1 hypothetical protein [Methylomarinum sp. Ch1-1]